MKAPSPPPTCIYLIDDDDVTNLVHHTQISRFDSQIEVRVFVDAREALADLVDLQARQPEALPGLILLDINMPGMNGWEFLEAYEAHGLHCPLMMLTSSIDDEDRKRAHSFASVTGFISKPLNASIIRELMGG